MVYLFGDYELDTRRFELRRAGVTCALEPQVFDVLAYLLQHRDRVVTKEELFEHVWSGRIVTDSALSNRIMAARKAIGDSGRTQHSIMTVHGRGFRFVAPVDDRSSGEYRAQASEHLPPLRAVTAVQGRPQEAVELLGSSKQLLTYRDPGSQPRVMAGRETELERLNDWLEHVVAHHKRRVVFIMGEAGIGKTTLVEALLHQARQRGGLWIGQGQCLEYRGGGEAYMPVLEAFGRMCRGPGGKDVIALLARYAPTWLAQMPGLLSRDEQQEIQRALAGSSRERMIREMAEAIEQLSAEKPLIVVLEDLHWSDYSTLDVIARLAQRQEPARFLLIGTYRPSDAVREGHPLHALQHALALHGQAEELSLGLLDPEAIAAYLASRFPESDFSQSFVSLIHERTDGNPLFMVRLLDDWISKGLLNRMEGRWAAPDVLNEIHQGVPDSLKQLVEQQLNLLSPQDQAVLEAASVAGMEFSAAAVAAGIQCAEEEAEERCATLARQGQFLHAGGIANWVDGTVATRFRFIHQLYREVLYQRVPAGRQGRLHHRIGDRLEKGYGAQAREHAVELAVHFIRGHDLHRAVQYLQWAAEQALQRNAQKEAVEHLRTAREIVLGLPESSERARLELAIQAALGSALVKMYGWASPEAEQAFVRARTLSEQLGDHPQLLPVLYELAVLYEYRGEYELSQELMNHRLRLAQDDFLPEAHELLACSTFYQGRFSHSLKHARQGLTVYDAGRQSATPGFWGHNSGILCRDWAALALWFLGYPDQARREASQAMQMAQAPENAHSLSNVHMKTAILYQCLHQAEMTAEHARATIALATHQGFAYRIGAGMILEGWSWAFRGEHDEAFDRIHEGLEIHKATGASMDRPYFLGLLADACVQGDRLEEGLNALSEALLIVQKSRTFFFEAELFRLRGTLLLQSKADGAEAERCFRTALEVARRQHSRSLELRAATSLARRWQQVGRAREARELLTPVLDGFTEGLDTHDMIAARFALEGLNKAASLVS